MLIISELDRIQYMTETKPGGVFLASGRLRHAAGDHGIDSSVSRFAYAAGDNYRAGAAIRTSIAGSTGTSQMTEASEARSPNSEISLRKPTW